MNTVEHLLGVQVDYYVGFGMNVVKKVVDAVGGVDYDVDIAMTMNGRKLEKGQQHRMDSRCWTTAATAREAAATWTAWTAAKDSFCAV